MNENDSSGGLRTVSTTVVERSREEVWRVVADLGTHTAWRPAIVELHQLDEGPLRVGSRIREVLRWAGRTLELDDVVTEHDAPARLGMRGSWDGGSFDFTIVLEDAPPGTRVTLDWTLRPRGRLLRAAGPLLRRPLRRATDEEAGLLKAYVESLPATMRDGVPVSRPADEV